MRTGVFQGIQKSDLDAAGFKIINLSPDQPLPPVKNASVAEDAAIDQSKLNLNGQIPAAWLGTDGTTAAAGNAAELLSRKGQANGYAGLDSGGKVPSSQLPAAAGTGTVTSVDIATANGVSATGGPITSSGSLTLSLGSITPTKVRVAGTAGAGSLALAVQSASPASNADLQLFLGSLGGLVLVHNTTTGGHYMVLNAATLTADRVANFPDKTGTLAMTSDLATAMVGVGGSHKGGLVPDPGASGSATDYLGRDAAWHTAATFSSPAYQPTLINPTFSASTNTTGSRNVTLGAAGASGTSIFYSLTGPGSGFLPYTGGSISVAPGQFLWAYQAKTGYTNSSVVSYENPNDH